jgi:hypothetical protein
MKEAEVQLRRRVSKLKESLSHLRLSTFGVVSGLLLLQNLIARLSHMAGVVAASREQKIEQLKTD